MTRTVAHRGLTFDTPSDWLLTGQLVVADATVPGGLAIIVGEEPRPRGENLDSFAARKLAAVRAVRRRVDVVQSLAIFHVGGEPAQLLRLRYRAPESTPGEVEHVFALVRASEVSFTVVSFVAGADTIAEHEPLFEQVLKSIRFDEPAPKAPRLRPHRASFELPVEWEEVTTWSLHHPSEPAMLAVRVEPRHGAVPFAKCVEQRLALATNAGAEVTETTAALRIADRNAHRLAIRTQGENARDDVNVLVDGGPTPGTLTTFTASGPVGSAGLNLAEGALEKLLGSIAIKAEGAAPRRTLEVGSSLDGLVIAHRPHDELHVDLVKKGFVPTRVPLAAPTTRTGERRFARIDGKPTAKLDDPELATEWIYAHEDGGTIRVFPDGHMSFGLGGTLPASVRASRRSPRSRDLSLDAELGAFGREGLRPRTLTPAHGLYLPADARQEHVLAAAYMNATWMQLAMAKMDPVPVEDRVGLRLTRSIVFARDFEEVVPRIERLAASLGAARRELGSQVIFRFSATELPGCDAGLTLDLGSHSVSIDPIGVPGSVDRLQRLLRPLLLGERYRVFDESTGDDVTATVERLPSFLVAPTRRRPELFTSAG